MAIGDRVKKFFNTFFSNDQGFGLPEYGASANIGSARPERNRLRYTSERTILSSIYTRISIDFAAIDIRHIKLDDEGRYLEDVDSGLNECFNLEANIDQAPRQFRQDVLLSLFDKGVAVIVPVDTSVKPEVGKRFDVHNMRVGEVTSWFPKHVRVDVYNEGTGSRQQVTLEKRFVAIIENPLYSVMNEPNSTLQRLLRKLTLLDAVDEQSGSGKLDLIIQLPYVVKSEARRLQAEQRRQDIEFQLKGSQYGIAYTDGTEKITQLNRPAENNLLKQVEYLTTMLYGQLGLTEEIMNGTADEKAMLAYFNRTIEPLVVAMVQALRRAFLGRDGVRAKEDIRYFQNPFKLVPVGDLAEIADKFTRNEIFTSNEIRGFMGVKPSKDPKADMLINSNMPQSDQQIGGTPKTSGETRALIEKVLDSRSSNGEKVKISEVTTGGTSSE